MVSTIKAFEKTITSSGQGTGRQPSGWRGRKRFDGGDVGGLLTGRETIKLVPFGWLAWWGKETRSAYFRRQQMYD
jgi:hypothetical protein